jgi:hypothetical protein
LRPVVRQRINGCLPRPRQSGSRGRYVGRYLDLDHFAKCVLLNPTITTPLGITDCRIADVVYFRCQRERNAIGIDVITVSYHLLDDVIERSRERLGGFATVGLHHLDHQVAANVPCSGRQRPARLLPGGHRGWQPFYGVLQFQRNVDVLKRVDNRIDGIGYGCQPSQIEHIEGTKAFALHIEQPIFVCGIV